MQTPTTIFETYQLVESTRHETKEIAIAAIREHIARMQDPAFIADPENPLHKSYVSALEFACTLVRLS
jgi:hypothetical protein